MWQLLASLALVQSLSCPILRPHGLQLARLPCPSPSPGVCSNSCPLSRWCHLTISSSVISSSCLQSFPASGSFPVSWLFASGGQSFGASISASSLPVNIQDWFHLPAVQRTLKSLLQHHSLKPSILQHSALFMVQVSRLYMTTGKTIALTIQTFVSKVMTLIFNVLSRFVMSFLPRSECLSVYGCSQHPQWFWSPGK